MAVAVVAGCDMTDVSSYRLTGETNARIELRIGGPFELLFLAAPQPGPDLVLGGTEVT